MTMLIVAILGALGSMQSPAARANTAMWAYVFANDPSTPSYTPDVAFQANSTGATNMVFSAGPGAHVVVLPGLGGEGGIAQVTAVGSDFSYCTPTAWSSLGSDQRVEVQCFDSVGDAANVPFTLTYVNGMSPSGTGLMGVHGAYIYYGEPSGSFFPNPLPQFNSTGAANTITRQDVGVYSVEMPGLGTLRGGIFLVSAVGGWNQMCKAIALSYTDPALIGFVRCYDAAGAPVDASFALTYMRAGDALIGGGQLGMEAKSAYVFSEKATEASYTPFEGYQFNSSEVLNIVTNSPGALNSVTRANAGVYTVTLPGLGESGGVVQVAPFGAPDTLRTESCMVASWEQVGADQRVEVRCFDIVTGQPADAPFALNYLNANTYVPSV